MFLKYNNYFLMLIIFCNCLKLQAQKKVFIVADTFIITKKKLLHKQHIDFTKPNLKEISKKLNQFEPSANKFKKAKTNFIVYLGTSIAILTTTTIANRYIYNKFGYSTTYNNKIVKVNLLLLPVLTTNVVSIFKYKKHYKSALKLYNKEKLKATIM